MFAVKPSPKFNKAWAKGVTEAEFVKAFEGVEQYKQLDLKAIHKKIVGKEKPIEQPTS